MRPCFALACLVTASCLPRTVQERPQAAAQLLQLSQAVKDQTDAQDGRVDNQDAWTKLVATGKVDPKANPWERVGIMETLGARVAAAYKNDLMGQIDSASTMTDAKGVPVESTGASKAIADTWSKYSGNPLLKDFYAGKAATQVRLQADESFRKAVSEKVHAAGIAVRDETFRNALGETFSRWAANPNPPKEGDYQYIGDALTQMRRVGMAPDALRENVVSAVKFATSVVDANDTGEGAVSEKARLARFLQDVPMGTTTLGKDAETGVILSQMISQADTEHIAKQREMLTTITVRRSLSVDKATSDLLPAILEAQKKGEDVTALVSRKIDEIASSNRFGPDTPYVTQALKKTAGEVASTPYPEDKNLIDALHVRIATDSFTSGVAADVQAAVENHRISAQTWASLRKELGERDNAVAVVPRSREVMESAARGLLAALDEDRRSRARIPFEDMRRKDWHYVPRERSGLPLGDLDEAQRKAFRALLDSALSEEGLRKVDGVIELEGVLREIESSPARDPGRYFVSLFGEPGPEKPWGWRFEGHHLSLNFVSIGERVAVTPLFLGANPEEVRSGPHAGMRVLASEEDLARGLALSLDAAQRAEGVKEDEVPGDVILGPGRAASFLEPPGVSGAKLSKDQRALLRRIAELYPGNLDSTLAGDAIEHVRSAADADLHFVWIGGTKPGQPHYWRVQGKGFAIELDNVQGGASHVHTLWRDLDDDFGEDLLRRHYEEHHARR